jgi:outer membrane protein assembly factor BamB
MRTRFSHLPTFAAFGAGALLVGVFYLAGAHKPAPAFADKAASGGAAKGEMPMFGGSPSRNMANLHDKNILPDLKSGARPDLPEPKPGGKVDFASLVTWKEALGSRSYAGPVIADGKVLCGTNNDNPRNDRDRGKPAPGEQQGEPEDKSIIMCFNAADGKFLWQMVHDKLPSGQVHDWPHIGLCSTPCVIGDRLYYVSNQCRVVCADMNGFLDGKNDGVQTEKYKDKTDGDVIWDYDMMAQLRVFPHNISCSSPVVAGDIVFALTGNGVDENHINIPEPESPSFIALNKNTGKLLWKNNSPGRNIMHGQWSNASYGVIKGVPTVIFPGGDGWLHAFKPDTGEDLWKFDANPKDSKYDLGGKGTRSDFIGTPVIHNDKVYIGTGQDPEHFEGVGHFYCIDPAGKTGDISPELVEDASVDPPKTKPNPNSGMVWHYGGAETHKFARRDFAFGRTMSTACIVDDVVYIAELAGYLHCLDAKTGKKYWQYDLKSAVWGSAYYVDGKVLIGNEDGDLFIFRHEKQPEAMDEVEIASKEPDEKAAGKKRTEVRKAVEKKNLIAKIAVEEPIRSTPVVADGTLYVMTEKTLFAIRPKK